MTFELLLTNAFAERFIKFLGDPSDPIKPLLKVTFLNGYLFFFSFITCYLFLFYVDFQLVLIST